MAFSGEGALGGAAQGAAAGSVAGPWGAAIGGVAGGVMGGLMGGKKKAATPDITKQLLALQQNRQKQQQTLDPAYAKAGELTNQYSTDTQSAIEDIRNRTNVGTNQYLGDINKNVEQSKDALRRSLYGNTFSGTSGALQAVREAGAAGAGVGSGAYLKGVQNVGADIANRLATGEQDIQAKGLQTMADARTNAYSTFSNLESKLGSANLDRLTTVMDTGRSDVLQKMASEMGLNTEETQGLIDLMNFQQSGQMASESANAASKNDLSSIFAQGAGTVAGNLLKKK